MSNLQKFIRLKPLLIFSRILIFITLFAQFSQFILSQDSKETHPANAFQELDLSFPFKICWYLKNEEPLNNFIASDNIIFLSSVGGIIKSIDSESGDKRWETDLGGEIISIPYIDGENVYVVSKPKESQNEIPANNEVSANDSGKNIIIRSLNISSGVTIWQTNVKTDLIPEQIFLYVYKSSLLIADKNGNLHSISKNDGVFKWKKSLGVKLSAPPYFYADNAILGTFENQLIILNLSEDKIYKKVDLHVIPTAISLNTDDETLIIGDRKGVVSSIKIEKTEYEITKKEKKEKKEKKGKNNSWKFRLGAEVSNISITPGGLLITSLDNFAYLISAEKGNLKWKKRLVGRISDKSLVLDNYALITTTAKPTISVVELSTGKLINEIILENEDFVTANPIKIRNKIIVPTSKGLYAFAPKECYEIEN
jgi:outer membrane protein assembly factor BamB